MEIELHEGLFTSEGHFIEFRLGSDDFVWVDEAISSDDGSVSDSTAYIGSEITSHIFQLNDALNFQKILIDMGYNFFPLFELDHLRESETIH